MLYAIDMGHNCSPDTGAVSNSFSEDKLVKLVGNKIIKLLEKYGHKTLIVTPKSADSVYHSLRQRVGVANQVRADLYVSLHFNAFDKESANGAEVYVFNVNSAARPIALRVLKNITGLGYRNRGVKHHGFHVIKYTVMPAMLIECCFITNTKDMARFNSIKMAEAIVKGLLNISTLPVPPEEDIPGEPEAGILKVKEFTYGKPGIEQASIFNIKDLYRLEKGKYEALLLAEEENHLVVRLDGKEMFVYADKENGHVEFIGHE